jgi:hypothetical protein
MTQTTTTETATFSETMRMFNSELLALIKGEKIKTAKAVNNLEYRSKSGSQPRCGLLLITQSDKQVGLFRWDLLPSKLELVNDQLRSVQLNDLLHTEAREALKSASGEEEFLSLIANKIVGKTINSYEFVTRRSNGAPYADAILIVE